MKNKTISGRTTDAIWLLAVTLGLAVMGLLVQLLGNRLEESIYTDRIVRYWACILLFSVGAFLLWKAMNIFRQRNPFAFQTVQTALLLVMFILNIYAIVEEVRWNFSFSDWELSETPAYTSAIIQSKLLGSTPNMETILPDLFWRWESNGILPALGLGYGLAVVFLYIWLGITWVICALGCMRHIQGETYLLLYTGEEVMLEVNIAKLVFLTALLALVPKVLFQTLAALLGARVFYGGTLFSMGDVSFLSPFSIEAGITQLLIMAYLLYLPGSSEPEEVYELPEEEIQAVPEEPEPEKPADSVETEESPEAEAQEESPAAQPRELTAEDFARANYTYDSHTWDDEYGMPYFHVPGGWYYMTGNMIQPEKMVTGQSVLVGEGNYLRRIDPNNPEQGEHLYWV